MRSSFICPQTAGTSAVVAMLALLSFAGAPAVAQESAPSLDSYRRAREVLLRGIDAMGGLDSIRAIQDVTLEQLGTRHLRNQSLRADPPYTAAPWSGRVVFDARNGRLRSDQEGMGSVGFPFRNRVVTDGRQRFTADLLSRTLTPGGDAAISAHQALLDRLPHLLLTDQLDRAASLRWLGESTVSGTRYWMISGASGPATRTYFFDARTGLLARYETVGPDPIAGDAVTEVAFTDYRKVGPIMVPSRRTQRVAGELVQDDRYTDVRLNTRPADSLFARPAAFAERAQGGQWPQGMTQVAPGLHLLQGVAQGYNMLVAEFGDHLVVVEAPNNSAVTERAIAAIKRAIPGKPIRYVVPTHHHGDHAGGMRAFVAEGATIVTTPGNAGLFRRMAAATYTLPPDALARTARPPVIETIAGKRRVFSDATRRIELIDIGPGPHTEEMIVVWMPEAGLVFQGDLMNAGNDGSLEPGNETTAHFAQWLERSGLGVRTILGVHPPARTPEELRRAVEMMRAAP